MRLETHPLSQSYFRPRMFVSVPAVMLLRLLYAAHLHCQMGGASCRGSKCQWDILEGLECSIRKGKQAFRFSDSEQPSIGSVSHGCCKISTVTCCCCRLFDAGSGLLQPSHDHVSMHNTVCVHFNGSSDRGSTGLLAGRAGHIVNINLARWRPSEDGFGRHRPRDDYVT